MHSIAGAGDPKRSADPRAGQDRIGWAPRRRVEIGALDRPAAAAASGPLSPPRSTACPRSRASSSRSAAEIEQARRCGIAVEQAQAHRLHRCAPGPRPASGSPIGHRPRAAAHPLCARRSSFTGKVSPISLTTQEVRRIAQRAAPPAAICAVAGQLGRAIDVERIGRIGLEIGRALLAIEHVVRRNMHQRNVAARRTPPPRRAAGPR